jgi:HEPN superfamily AbiU2-like protein
VTKPIRIKDSVEFGSLMKGLARDIVNANIHYRLHKNLSDAIPEYVTELNQSAAFWNLTISAQIDAALLRLCRAYDSHTASLSLPRLLATIENNLHVFDTPQFKERLKDSPFVESLARDCRIPKKKELKADFTIVSASDPLVKRLLAWRNNIGAHRNPRETLSPNSVVVAPLEYPEIEELLGRSKSILNQYSLLFRALEYSVSMVGADDYKYVLGCIRKDIAAGDREFEKEMAKYKSSP